MCCRKRLYFNDSEMVVETVDSTVVNVTEGPSPPEDVKESLELDVDTFSVRVVEDDSSCTHRKATSQLCSPHVQAFIQQQLFVTSSL